LESELSRQLRQLSLVGCHLNAAQMSRLLVASAGHVHLHLDLSENTPEELSFIADAIGTSSCPPKLTMRLLEFCHPEDFTVFFQALGKNASIRCLDVSGAAISFVVTDNTVSDGLQKLFTENRGLEVLNISGEMCRLDSNDFGGEVADSLVGLNHNSSLKILRMERQKLGQKGANVLASVLYQNVTLQEVYISHNNIPLAGLTAIVEALKENTSVTHLSRMDESKAAHLLRIQSAVHDFNSGVASGHRIPRKPVEGTEEQHHRIPSMGMDFIGKKLSVGQSRGKSGDFGLRQRQHAPERASTPLDDVEKVIEDKWVTQQTILEEYLLRNRRLRAMESNIALAEEGDGALDSPMHPLSTEHALDIHGSQEVFDLQVLQDLHGPTALNSPTIIVEDVDGEKKMETNEDAPTVTAVAVL
jgi:hypothetical protein